MGPGPAMPSSGDALLSVCSMGHGCARLRMNYPRLQHRAAARGQDGDLNRGEGVATQPGPRACHGQWERASAHLQLCAPGWDATSHTSMHTPPRTFRASAPPDLRPPHGSVAASSLGRRTWPTRATTGWGLPGSEGELSRSHWRCLVAATYRKGPVVLGPLHRVLTGRSSHSRTSI